MWIAWSGNLVIQSLAGCFPETASFAHRKIQFGIDLYFALSQPNLCIAM
jgi:hypothetical protein